MTREAPRPPRCTCSFQLDVKGSSGVHYHAVETNDVPADARAAIEADSASE